MIESREEYNMLKWDAGKVVVVDDAHKVKGELRTLYTNDRSASKKFFRDAITYAYFMYMKNSMYKSLFPKDRAKEVSVKYFGDAQKWKKFEYNDAFADFRKYYESIQYDAEERALIALETEIEDMILHLKDVKYFINDTVDVEIDVPSYDGSEETIRKTIKKEIQISNYKEKKNALMAIGDIIKTRKLLKEEIKIKVVEQKNHASKSLLDRGAF